MPKSLYKYMSAERAIAFLTNLRIRFTRPLSFNDPFEFNPSVFESRNECHKDKLRWNDVFRNPPFSMTNFINDRVGLLCLSEDPANIPMWGHYASGFSGAVIEFNAEHDWFSCRDSSLNEIKYLARVRYTSRRPTLTIKFIKKLQFGENASSWRTLLRQRQDLFLTKSVAWSYEKEWRYIRTLDIDDNIDPLISNRHSDLMSLYGFKGEHPFNARTIQQELFSVPADAIKSVIIGPCARRPCSFGQIDGFEEVVLETVLSRESMKHIAVNRAILDSESYSVKFVDMSNWDDIEDKLSDVDVRDLKVQVTGREMVKSRIKRGEKGINPYERKITSYS